MAIRYGRGDVKQTTTGFRGPLMVQSLTSAKSKFLSLFVCCFVVLPIVGIPTIFQNFPVIPKHDRRTTKQK